MLPYYPHLSSDPLTTSNKTIYSYQLTFLYHLLFAVCNFILFLKKQKKNSLENISFGDGLVYPTKGQHSSTDYESLTNSTTSRLEIEGDAKNTVEIKPLGTVLIDVDAGHTTETSRTKSNNVVS